MRLEIMNVSKCLFCVVAAWVLVSCAHEDELRKELFDVNTRLLTLESETHDKQQINSRQYVSASGRVEQIESSLQKINGELDRLRIGVQKGEIPGEDHESSLAKQLEDVREKLKDVDAETLSKLDERVSSLEKAQMEILALLEKLNKKKGEKKSSSLNSLKAIELAFQKKHYKEIVEEAPLILEKKAHKDKDAVRYYFSESLFKVGNLKEAAISFSELIKKDKLGEWGPKIHLRMGDCFLHLGDKKAALVYYKQVLGKFPNAPETASAKKHIKKLEDQPL